MKLLPAALTDQLVAEAKAHARHWPSWLKNRNRFRGKTGLKVNVGCGQNIVDGWINLDLTNDPRVICWDCRRSLPFDDNSVSAIFTEHVFEHLYHPDETMAFLAECRRILEPGGVVRIVVPDVGKYLRLYGNGWDGLIYTRDLAKVDGGYRDGWLQTTYATQMEMMNAIFRQGVEHKYGWDAETLMRVMREAGFQQVTEQSFGVSLRGHPLDSESRKRESLYVEAVK